MNNQRGGKAFFADRVSDIIHSALEDDAATQDATNVQLAVGTGFLALSPFGGLALGTVFFSVGTALSFIEIPLLSYVYGSSFERNTQKLDWISQEYLDEPLPEIPTPKKKEDHALVSRCATISFFSGCIGNCVLPRTKYPYGAMARSPFFLLGGLGLVLRKYADRYTHEQNAALLMEAHLIRKRLSENE